MKADGRRTAGRRRCGGHGAAADGVTSDVREKRQPKSESQKKKNTQQRCGAVRALLVITP